MLIVEDGSGVPSANSYLSMDEADAYHSPRGNAAWGAASPADKEAALVRATDHLDATYSWRGDPGPGPLAWPRRDAFDNTDALILGVPDPIRRACAELASRALSAELRPDLPRLAIRESIGPVSVAYAPGASPETVRPLVDALVRPFIRNPHELVRC